MPLPTIAGVTRTLCDLFGVECLDDRLEDSFPAVTDAAEALGMERCQRGLLYAPDAIGLHLCLAYPEIIAPVAREAPTTVRLQSAFPTKTPVCYATMFTGLPPEIHGIRQYEKPLLRCATLFDWLVAGGQTAVPHQAGMAAARRVAIVAVRDSSIDRIFRERPIDYFSEDYDPQVTATTLRLVEAGEHDVILAYHQKYDDTMHRTTPRSPEAIEALGQHVATFVELSQAVHRCWAGFDRMIGFVPDHGAHVDPETGRGTHGLATPDDMDVQHFYGVFRRGTG